MFHTYINFCNSSYRKQCVSHIQRYVNFLPVQSLDCSWGIECHAIIYSGMYLLIFSLVLHNILRMQKNMRVTNVQLTAPLLALSIS